MSHGELFRVSCLDDSGLRVWATRRTFQTSQEAVEYALTINQSREALVHDNDACLPDEGQANA